MGNFQKGFLHIQGVRIVGTHVSILAAILNERAILERKYGTFQQLRLALKNKGLVGFLDNLLGVPFATPVASDAYGQFPAEGRVRRPRLKY